MQSTPSWIFGVGLLAQLLFSARVLYQWIVTEKARKVLSPPAFWVLSIIGSYLLFIYGVLRDDFSIILGQFLSYYVYLWNLNMQKLWGKIAGIVKVMLLLTPVAAVAYMLRDPSSFNLTFFHNQDIPLWLLILVLPVRSFSRCVLFINGFTALYIIVRFFHSDFGYGV
jgi:lipid-A-disaccharide synthase-like uncharacterized protein